jgi:putative holliday junction resolvase
VPGGADLPLRLARRADEELCDTVVIGLPLGMSGRDTDSTRAARSVATALQERGVDVELWDERLSSAEAERSLLGAGRTRDQRRQQRDRIAATIILQGWIDAWRSQQQQG